MAKSVNAILMVLAAVLLVPAASYAAGLGTITVRSALGQPLDAEIEVVALRPGEDIQVRLASREAYQNAGIDLSSALQGARFAVERRDGRTVIRVRTSQPVNDPFFSVLVELQSPTGRLSRQYTVLVDPVEYRVASTAQQAAAAPAAAATAPTPAAAPARAQVQPPKVAASQAPRAAPAAPVAVVVAPPAPVAPTSAPAPAPSAPQSVAGSSVTERPIAVAREPTPAPVPATQPLVVAQPIATPPSAAAAPVAPAPAASASETLRPAEVAAQPAPAAIQTPAVAVAPALADASTATPVKRPDSTSVSPSVEPAPAPSATTLAPPAPVAQAAVPPAPSSAAPATVPVQQNTEVQDAYRIRRGDTLGAIARKWKPEGVSYEQMMVGLYETNRSAFIRDNINLIRAGATLFIPGRDDVLAINAADAARQVRTHMAAFTKYRDTTVSAGAGSGRISQAQREVISRRGGVKRSSRAM